MKHGSILSGNFWASRVRSQRKSTPKTQNAQSVGLCASVNYEIQRNLAFTENAFWNFDAAERDFRKLLQMHDWVAPHDLVDKAEILLEIGLNLSSSERVEEANGFFSQADAELNELRQDKVLAQQYQILHTKSVIYRAVGALERKQWVEAIRLVEDLNKSHDIKPKFETRQADDQAVVLDWTPSHASRVTIAATSQASQRLLLSTSSADATSAQKVLQAQRLYVLAAAHRNLGLRDQAKGELMEAESVLAFAESPPTWLVAMIEREKADSLFEDHKPLDAETHIQKAIAVLNASAPQSRLLGHMLLRHADIADQLSAPDRAIKLGDDAINILTEQTAAPGFPPDLVANQLARLLAAIQRPAAMNAPAQRLQYVQDYFRTLALAWTGPAARSAIQLAARLESGINGKVIRDYQEAERAYVQAAAQHARVMSECGLQLAAPRSGESSEAKSDKSADCLSEDTRRILDARLEAVEVGARKYKIKQEAAVLAISPHYLELLSPKVELEQLQSALLANGDDAYIRFVPTKEKTFGVLVKRDVVIPFGIESGQFSLAGRVGQLRQTLFYGQRGPPIYPIEVAHHLYQDLFKDIESQLANSKRLHIDANGALAELSFGALVLAAPNEEIMSQIKDDADYSGVHWLSRKYLLDTALGPAAFVKHKASQPASIASSGELLAFGDYVPNPQKTAMALSPGRGNNRFLSAAVNESCVRKIEAALAAYPALPRTRQEAQKAVEAFGEKGRSIVGAEFTDLAFKKDPQVQQASILLFATHGVVGLSDCFTEPALLTSYAPDGHGLLSASEILDETIPARVVILSACDTTAGGKINRTKSGFTEGAASGGGERLSGLVRSFIYAGSRSVLATLWAADESSSMVQTTSLIRNLKAGRRLDEALQDSQRQLISGGARSHPYYWASFILVGDSSEKDDPRP